VFLGELTILAAMCRTQPNLLSPKSRHASTVESRFLER
jgi:hypothetical protein